MTKHYLFIIRFFYLPDQSSARTGKSRLGPPLRSNSHKSPLNHAYGRLPPVTKPRISARIAAIAESATLAVDAKAKALKAAGRPVIGFGAGEPDFPTPDYIVQAATDAAKVVANHRYSPTPGLPELREAIVKKTKRDSNYEITADQVLVTNGGKQAVYQAFATIVDKGDEVILPSPYWTTYPECIKLAGGVAVEVFADESQNYLV
ncbi:MAG: hypothetical protein RIS57_660, partial [Actinomycetota bacterium]